MGWQAFPLKDEIGSPEGGVSPFFGMIWICSFGSPGFPARSFLPGLTVCLGGVFHVDGEMLRRKIRSE